MPRSLSPVHCPFDVLNVRSTSLSGTVNSYVYPQLPNVSESVLEIMLFAFMHVLVPSKQLFAPMYCPPE